MTERAARAASFLPAGPLALFGLYLIVMLVQAALLAPSGRSDDLETLLLAQSLEWGYHAKNPPAFYWLAHGVMAATGPSLPVDLRAAARRHLRDGGRALRAGAAGAARPAARGLRRLRRARHAALPLVPDVPPDQHRAGAGAGAGAGARGPEPARARERRRLCARRAGGRARAARALQLPAARRRAARRRAHAPRVAPAADAPADAGGGGGGGGAGRPARGLGDRQRRDARRPRRGAARRRSPLCGAGRGRASPVSSRPPPASSPPSGSSPSSASPAPSGR